MRYLTLIFGFLFFSIPSVEAEEIRLAIIAGNEHQAAADLLLAKLSANPQMALVEREQVEKIINEQRLSAGGLTANQALTLGRILNAQGVVLFRTISSQDGSRVQAALVAVQSGAILASVDLPRQRDVAELVEAVSARVLKSLPKFTLAENEVVKLSVVNFRPLRGAGKVAPPFTKLLTAALADSSDFVVLERSELRMVTKEKGLSGEDLPFWAGSYLVRGTLEGEVQNEKLLRISLEIVPPGQTIGEVYKVEGSRDDLTALVKAATDAVTGHFKKHSQPLAEDWREAEAHYFLREAEVAFRDNKERAPWQHAYSAWALGLRDPRLAEILIMLHLEKEGRVRYGGGSRSSHFMSRMHNSGEVLRDWVHLASHFDRNPRYWRGMPGFWYPEGLDEVDEVVGYYKAFAEGAQNDPKLLRIDDEGVLAVEVLRAASIPHILIHREAEGEKYHARLRGMAVDLRKLYAEMLSSGISRRQKEHLIKIHAAMVAFWANDGDIKGAIRQVLASYPAPEEFAERAASRAGLMAGFYLASQYARLTDLKKAFHDLKPELLASPDPEDRLVGEYIHYYSKELPLDDWKSRRVCIERMFQQMDAITPKAAQAPHALGTYLLEIQMLFDEEDWTNRKIEVPYPKNYTNSDDSMEGLVDSLTRKLARKYQLFFLDHWPKDYQDDLRGDAGGAFSYWASNPGVFHRGSERQPSRDMQDIKDYYNPLLERYQAEKAKPEPNQKKLKFLAGPFSMASRFWPELVSKEDAKAALPQVRPATKLTAPLRWSLSEHFGKLAGTGEGAARGTIVDATPDRISVMGETAERCVIFDVSLPDFQTTSVSVPYTESDDYEARPERIVRDERFLYVLGGPKFSLLQLNRKTGEWTKLPNLNARSGFVLDGWFYFTNAKEFFRLSPKDGELEVLASVDRTPASSPLDDANLLDLFARNNDGVITITATLRDSKEFERVNYEFNPSTREWSAVDSEEAKAERAVQRSKKNMRGVMMGDVLLFSQEKSTHAELMKSGIAIPIDCEGEKPSPMPHARFRRNINLPSETGFVVCNSSPVFAESDFRLWFLEFDKISEYIRNNPGLPHGFDPRR